MKKHAARLLVCLSCALPASGGPMERSRGPLDGEAAAFESGMCRAVGWRAPAAAQEAQPPQELPLYPTVIATLAVFAWVVARRPPA